MDDRLLLDARARVLADLTACRQATAAAVSALDQAVSDREWWAAQWPEGAPFVAGLVAQDVQDALFEQVGRWPLCVDCGPDTGPPGRAGDRIDVEPHALYIQPDLGGPDPVWVCEETGRVAAALGFLDRRVSGR